MTPLLELKQITKIYQSGEDKLYALNNIDLTVQEGEFLAIMGASGSGKSTLMNIIGALDRATSGEYKLRDVPVNSLGDKELSRLRNQKIGFVFQAFNLLPRYDAIQNVEVPLIYAKRSASARRQSAIAALERVGLASRVHHRPTQLSGGQQQRVAIARAIVTSPVLLLADEPTGALDSETTSQILELLEQLNEQGMSVIVVTHEYEVAQRAKRIVQMRDGKIIEDIQNTPSSHDAPLQTEDAPDHKQ